MSNETILRFIKISQSDRWYFWRVRKFVIPRREIETHSSNMHIIPATERIMRMIKRTRIGEAVEFSDYLVRADADDGWHWISSLSRTDRGNHSRELVWAEILW